MPVPGVPQVNCDNQAILELIFNHLRARNFRTVILLDDESSLVSEPRRANFVKLCTKHTCLPNVIGLRHLSDISLENRELVTKLEHLPKPAAIILTSDYQWSSLAAVCDNR